MAAPMLSDWYVVPHGSPGDLSLLERLLDGASSHSLKDVDGEWQLRSLRLAHAQDPTSAVEIGRELLADLADAAGALSTSLVRVRAGGLGRTNPDGTSGKWVFPTPAVAQLRVFAAAVSTGAEPAESPEARLIRLQESNADVRTAMHFLNAEESWYDLYKTFETIRRAQGGERSMIDTGWVTRGQIRRFTSAAQRYRHAPGTHPPPVRPMAVAEAEQWVRDLFRSWVNSLP